MQTGKTSIADRELAFSFDWGCSLHDEPPQAGALIVPSLFSNAIPAMRKVHASLDRIRAGEPQGSAGPVRFMHLPRPEAGVLPESELEGIEAWARRMKRNSEIRHLLYIGIGGSGLGPIMLHDSLKGPWYNRLGPHKRGGWPTVDFIDNVDPDTLEQFRQLLDFARTMFVVCSKSGDTVEPLASYNVCEEILKVLGVPLSGRLTFITGRDSALWRYGESLGADLFTVPEGIGGRWSVLCPVGLIPAAAAGSDIRELLRGAEEMESLCRRPEPDANPAYAYASVLHLVREESGVQINAVMPYRDRLRTLAFWATQLFMESLGKKSSRPDADGNVRTVHCGYTILPSRGSTDQHSTGQEFVEGPHNKIVTFIRTDDPGADFEISQAIAGLGQLAYLRGHSMAEILGAFQKGTQEALYAAGRPSVTVSVANVSERSLGQLIMFFEYTVAALAELLDVNAYDQPGVAAGKKAARRILDQDRRPLP